MKCGVVIPVGPGHEDMVKQAVRSVTVAAVRNRGPFDDVVTVTVDDIHGLHGRSRARNEGIRKAVEAGCAWLFFLDADDLMLPGAFEAAVPYFDTHDGIWGAIVEQTAADRDVCIRCPQALTLESIEELLMFHPYHSLQMGHFVRAEYARFDEARDTGEDVEYYLRVWSKTRCIKQAEPLFVNRRYAHSRGPRAADGRQWRENVEPQIESLRVRYGIDMASDSVRALVARKESECLWHINARYSP